MGKVLACQVCSRGPLHLLLNMGIQPLAERMGKGPHYPLMVARCDNCHLVQLAYEVDQAEVFPPDHPYATGNTKALRTHLHGLALKCLPVLKDGDLVVDIGANDGTLLKAFAMFSSGLRLVGVEPTNQARKMGERIDARQEYFTSDTAREIREHYGPAKVITATNVLAHVPDVHVFVNGIDILLADDGLFVTENHDWASVAEGLQIDTIYHEHLRFYTLESLSYLLAMHDLSVHDYQRIPVHGGSFRVTARKWRGHALGTRAVALSRSLHATLEKAAREGEIYGVGATTRATPLIHFAGLAPFIHAVVEIAGSEKIGHYMPGTDIPVWDEEALFRNQPPYALLLSWHLKAGLIPKLRSAGYRGKFIIPLPEPEIIE